MGPGPQNAPLSGTGRPLPTVAGTTTPGGAPAANETSAQAPGRSPDLLILDIWPPTPNAAEVACATAHARHPDAAIIAVVHHPTLSLARTREARGGYGPVAEGMRP